MHLRNSSFPLRALPLVLLGALAFGQNTSQPQNQNSQPPAGQQGKSDGGLIMPIDDGSQPAQGQQQQNSAQPQPGQQGKTDNGLVMPIENGQSEAPVPKSPNQPGDTVNVPASSSRGNGQNPDSEVGGVYTFKKQVEEVRLHATVVDDRQRLITTLDKTSFTVYENGEPQQITSFRHEDIPVALGVVIDNSGSMRDKRPAVNAATINLVKASNPEDEVFVVNFNDDYYLDQDYTDSVAKLKEALEKYETRGGTALYDAVLASNAHLMKAPKLEKKVLFIVTDGEDDASLNTLEQTIRKVQQENGPTIYTIGILDETGGHKRRAQRALREMAESTGGVAFFPQSLDEVSRITQQIAHDIRNQYTISYKPTNPQARGGYRQVKVEAKSKGFKALQVRTRAGYYAGQTQSAANPPVRKPETNAAVR
ncbi:VWA domain-containing protein [Candidatus Korobacter versatilis]|nr:VWA domain-containing protein [Candidatus Koribacter versatilis]